MNVIHTGFVLFFYYFLLKSLFCRVYTYKKKKISIRSSYVKQWGKHVTKTLKHLSWWWYLLCIICTSILFVMDLNLNIFFFVWIWKGFFVLFLFYFWLFRSKPGAFFLSNSVEALKGKLVNRFSFCVSHFLYNKKKKFRFFDKLTKLKYDFWFDIGKAKKGWIKWILQKFNRKKIIEMWNWFSFPYADVSKCPIYQILITPNIN